MIYYFILLLLALFSFYFQFDPKKAEIKVLSIVSFLCILALGGLRYQVGKDWYQYENLFNITNNFSDLNNAREEKLFMLFLYMSKSIVNNYSFFIFSLFTFTFYLKYRTIIKYSPDIFLSLIIYFFTIFLVFDLNAIRQGIATSIVLISISAILNKKLRLFILLILIASFFHLSAIIFLPFYWIAKFNISKKIILILIGISLILAIPIRIIIENGVLADFLLKMKYFSQYSAYINNKILGRDVSLLSIAVFQRVFIFSLFYFYFDKLKVREDLKILLINGYLAAILIFIFLSFSSELSFRISFYYKSLEILMIPIIVTSQNKISNKLILLLIFVLLSLFGTYRILDIPNGGLIPYHSILW